MFYKFRNRFALLVTVFVAVLSLFASACSSSDSSSNAGSSSSASSSSSSSSDSSSSDSSSNEEVSLETPLIVVTTSILGDVVTSMVGDLFEVETIMPPGADPHVFQASAQQVNLMMEADLLVVNGANFEEGLLDVIESAESDGVMVVEAISFVEVIESDGHDDHDEEGHDDHDEEGHDDHDDHDDHDEEGHDDHDEEGHDDHDEEGHDDHAHHDHGGVDPHFFTDPARMASAVEGLTAFLVENFPDVDQESLLANSNAYLSELNSLDSEVEEMLSSIPEGSRKLITNHSVFAYFADRYDFEILGSIIQSSSTLDSASAKDLADLVSVIKDENVSAIFADAASSNTLAQVLAEEAGNIEIITLFTESLGETGSAGSTYLDMVRTNGELITGGLTN